MEGYDYGYEEGYEDGVNSMERHAQRYIDQLEQETIDLRNEVYALRQENADLKSRLGETDKLKTEAQHQLRHV